MCWLSAVKLRIATVITLESIDAALPLNELHEAVDLPDEPRRLR